MFSFFRKIQQSTSPKSTQSNEVRGSSFTLEGLEGRTLLSAVLSSAVVGASRLSASALVASDTTSTAVTHGKIAFSDAPAAVQTGLEALAQGVTIPDTQKIKVKTERDGTVTYSTSVSVNGKLSKIAVEADGSALQGKIAFSNAPTVVQTGLQAQSTSVTLSASQWVTVRRGKDGVAVYSTSVSISGKTKVYSVNDTGTAVTKKGRELGNETTVLYSAAPAAVQTGLTLLAQGTTIAADQEVAVFTLPGGSTIYSALLSIDGVASRIVVAADGTLLDGSIAFSAAPAAVQTGLQTLATDGTIPTSQLVQIHTPPNGSSTYSTSVINSGDTAVIAVDAAGAQVTAGLPGGGGGGGDCGGGGGGGDFGGLPGDSGTESTIAYSAAPAAVQTGLNSLAQGTTIGADQVIDVRTLFDGTSTYETTLSINGHNSRIAVKADGTALEGEIAFSSAPEAVKTGLQTLDTAGTIPDTQLVRIDTFHDGTVVYSTSVTLDGVATIIAVDSTGTQVGGWRHPGGGLGGGGFGWGRGFGHRGGRHHGGFDGDGDSTGGTTTTDSGTSTSTPLARWASLQLGGSGFTSTNLAI